MACRIKKNQHSDKGCAFGWKLLKIEMQTAFFNVVILTNPNKETTFGVINSVCFLAQH